MYNIKNLKRHFKAAASTIIFTGFFFAAGSNPVLAYDNIAIDEIGAATTIYQHYVEDGAKEELSINTNVAGKSPEIEQFIDNTLGLATRLVPFSYDAVLQYYADTDPTTFFVQFRNRDYNDLNSEVQNKIAQLADEASALETSYEKIELINNYLVDHCEYLSAAMEEPELHKTAFTAYGALIEGYAVCEGYTNAVQLFCEAVGIPCMKVAGVVDGGNHIWNAVYLENKWWMLDTTFNDPIGEQTEKDRLRFFLLDMDSFDRIGLHTYDKESFETGKMILLGRTAGQATPITPLNLSAQNAEAQDKPNAALLRAEREATQANADVLHAMGLFAGDEGGYRLDDAMTRVEMGVMVMRMNGGVEYLQTDEAYYQECCPFTDVPDWARASIGFLYNHRLAAGQSDTTFGTGAVTKHDYAVMMLRVLHIEHTYDNALSIALQKGIVTTKQVKSNPIATRGDIVNMTYTTLQMLEEQKTSESESVSEPAQDLESKEEVDNTSSSAEKTDTIDIPEDFVSDAPELTEIDENTSDSTAGTMEDNSTSKEADEKEDALNGNDAMPL